MNEADENRLIEDQIGKDMVKDTAEYMALVEGHLPCDNFPKFKSVWLQVVRKERRYKMAYETYCEVIDGHDTWWRKGDSCRLSGPNDMTAGELFNYDAKCVWCYLGYGHSKIVHEQELKRAEDESKENESHSKTI
jgi:hypothetical protein